jgi:hypothetical protein
MRRQIDAIGRGLSESGHFECDPEVFLDVPGAPFAYWVTRSIARLFKSFRGFGEGVIGASTKNDYRYLRAWWEVSPEAISSTRHGTQGRGWVLFAKGGVQSRYFADIHLAINWRSDGRELKADISEYRGTRGWGYQWSAALNGHSFYFRPGITWPLRTDGLCFRILPSGCLFGHKGPTAFRDNDEPEQLLATSAVLNSLVFGYLVALQLARTELAQSYEVGLVQQTPVPTVSDADAQLLGGLGRRAWALTRCLDYANEVSHAFLMPAEMLRQQQAFGEDAIRAHVHEVQSAIDERVFELYGIGLDDCTTIGAATKVAIDERSFDHDEDASEGEAEENLPLADSSGMDIRVSWLAGIAFGRFDPRLATGERPIPPDPEPFDPLPSRSPGMWPEGEGPALSPPTILVDDEGHKDDLASHVLAAATLTRSSEPENVRAWLAREFFPLHIKMYSKSRRKAPIYWQLATPTASYSVWLYLHAFTNDTMFRVQNDYVGLKVDHEERKLESVRREIGDKVTATDRKLLAAQEAFVEELRAMLAEVKRIAPLWRPNLDDGVIINFAPLHRLVPQNKAWQKEVKATWDALVAGDYDWAHLAMHLWPERVVPRCATDRSLAIAHGLEDVFWVESGGKWTARRAPTRPVEELVKERLSPAVKAALKSLVEAPTAGASSTRAGRGRKKG